MRWLLSLSPHHPLRRLIGTLMVAGAAVLLTYAIFALVPGAREKTDNLLYDTFWRIHGPARPVSAEVLVIAQTDSDLKLVSETLDVGQTWPRVYWGAMALILAEHGARAIVFDLQFSERSDTGKEDDERFAELIARVVARKVPVIFAAKLMESQDGAVLPEPLVAELDSPLRGIVLADEPVLREYRPERAGHDMLALATLRACNTVLPEWAARPFRLRFYTRSGEKDGLESPFLYKQASFVLGPALDRYHGEDHPLSGPSQETLEQARGKIVLFGSTAAAKYDLFSSPICAKYPGVDWHATAMQNILGDEYVQTTTARQTLGLTIAVALLASALTVSTRRKPLRLLGGAFGAALLLVGAYAAFAAERMIWLPLTSPLTACAFATLGAFARVYLTEDHRRRQMRKALDAYVSREVAEQLEIDPKRLRLEAQQREMTVLFSDLAGFTDFSEAAPPRVLERMLGEYMERLSTAVLGQGGTIDKYIGDAIMAFWNAPLDQPDHAARACRAALAMRRAEIEAAKVLNADAEMLALLAPAPAAARDVAEMGVGRLYTRIGINTGQMYVGNWGSSRKFQYTVIGDAVNSAARLEPANKRYHTRILVAESVRAAAGLGFVFRQVDLLRVKGKLLAIGVYELMGESTDESAASGRALAQAFEAALALYRQQRWDAAESAALGILAEHADDGPSHMLLERVRALRQNPPAPDWDGVFVATDK